MKIKYFIFGLLVTVFSVINFSSAGNLGDFHLGYRDSVSGVFSSGYSYDVVPLDNYMQNNILRLTCYTRYNETKNNCGKGCSFDVDSFLNEGCSLDSITLTCYESPCNFTINSIKPPFLPGGTEALSGAISSLGNSVNEFIPYLVYISLGILSALLGFVSIKWLINWLRSKVLSPFK